MFPVNRNMWVKTFCVQRISFPRCKRLLNFLQMNSSSSVFYEYLHCYSILTYNKMTLTQVLSKDSPGSYISPKVETLQDRCLVTLWGDLFKWFHHKKIHLIFFLFSHLIFNDYLKQLSFMSVLSSLEPALVILWRLIRF